MLRILYVFIYSILHRGDKCNRFLGISPFLQQKKRLLHEGRNSKNATASFLYHSVILFFFSFSEERITQYC